MNTNTNLSSWNTGLSPLGELRREMGRLFDVHLPTSQDKWRRVESEWQPECDVEESDDHYLLALDMPGIPKDQIKIEVVNNNILISGERRQELNNKTDGAWYTERRYGKFHRTFALPAEVDTAKIEAHCRDGTLRIYVPKAESTRPRQIKISADPGTGFFSKLGDKLGDREAS